MESHNGVTGGKRDGGVSVIFFFFYEQLFVLFTFYFIFFSYILNSIIVSVAPDDGRLMELPLLRQLEKEQITVHAHLLNTFTRT